MEPAVKTNSVAFNTPNGRQQLAKFHPLARTLDGWRRWIKNGLWAATTATGLIGGLAGNPAFGIVNGDVDPDARVTQIVAIEQTPDGVVLARSSCVPVSPTTAFTCAHSLSDNVAEGDTFDLYMPLSEARRVLERVDSPTKYIQHRMYVRLTVLVAGLGVSGETTHHAREDLAVLVLVGNRFKDNAIMSIASTAPQTGDIGHMTGFGLHESANVPDDGAVSFSGDVSRVARSADVELKVKHLIIFAVADVDDNTGELDLASACDAPGDSGGSMTDADGHLIGILAQVVMIPANPATDRPKRVLSVAVNLRSAVVKLILQRAVDHGADADALAPLLPAETSIDAQ